MNITLYKTASDSRALLKTFTGTSKSVPITLKFDTDIMNPVFELDATGITPDFNYIYVQEWARYYFIKNITYIPGGRVEIACHIDVLMSHRAQISQETAIIDRQENEANLYIVDGSIPIENRTQVYFKQFPSGFDTGFKYYLTVGG